MKAAQYVTDYLKDFKSDFGFALVEMHYELYKEAMDLADKRNCSINESIFDAFNEVNTKYNKIARLLVSHDIILKKDAFLQYSMLVSYTDLGDWALRTKYNGFEACSYSGEFHTIEDYYSGK